jgi:hypothetical protein
MKRSIGARLDVLEGEAAKRASQKTKESAIDYSKLSDAALEELRASIDSGKVDYSKLSDATLEEIVAARNISQC